MRFNLIKTASQLTNIAIKNSEIVQPYIKPSHYGRGGRPWRRKRDALRPTHCR